MITVRVPATSANLGPGFDSLGMAFNLYNEFIFTEEKTTEDYSNNLIYQSMLKLFNKVDYKCNNIKIKVKADIPRSRGLGSSAACIIAGIVAANEISGANFTQEEILDLATEIEGHPDNVAPALYGGLVASVLNGSKVYKDKMEVSEKYKFLLLIPDFELSTQASREVLPKNLPFTDAVFNISRAILLTKAVEKGNFDLLCAVKEDKLHQPYRKSLIKGYEDFEVIAEENRGVLFLSGAGPTILVIAQKENNILVEKLRNKIGNMDNNWKLLELIPDNVGAIVVNK